MKKLRKVLVLLLIAYAVFTIINQQKTLNKYGQDSLSLSKQIEEEKETKEELTQKKEDVNSLEYIEQTAREKLDMYYPNERVYVDAGM